MTPSLKKTIALVNASGTHVVVPVEPTPEMLWEGFPMEPDERARENYAAMLSASLTHSEGETQ
jgi:hypothetical protein